MLRCSTQSRLEQNANRIRRKAEFAATEGSDEKERNPILRVVRDRGIQTGLDTLLHDDAMSKRNPPKIHDEEEEELTWGASIQDISGQVRASTQPPQHVIRDRPRDE